MSDDIFKIVEDATEGWRVPDGNNVPKAPLPPPPSPPPAPPQETPPDPYTVQQTWPGGGPSRRDATEEAVRVLERNFPGIRGRLEEGVDE